MDLKINFDHSLITLADKLGVGRERWHEITQLRDYAVEHGTSDSESIEWILKNLKDVQPCDLVIVGYLFG